MTRRIAVAVVRPGVCLSFVSLALALDRAGSSHRLARAVRPFCPMIVSLHEAAMSLSVTLSIFLVDYAATTVSLG
jgi:hypothetical protein